jgi:hypothetical protein
VPKSVRLTPLTTDDCAFFRRAHHITGFEFGFHNLGRKNKGTVIAADTTSSTFWLERKPYETDQHRNPHQETLVYADHPSQIHAIKEI